MSIYLVTKDYFHTKEEFRLEYDEELDMLKTKPIPKDLDKYYDNEHYISHTDHTTNLIDKIYHKVKKYSLYKKIRLINNLPTKDSKVLDIGAGTGDFLKQAKKNGWTIDGIEPNITARKIAASKNIKLNKNIDILKDNTYDIITLWHVLEHIPDLETDIEKIKNKLKHEGYLIIAVPNFKSYDAQIYKEFWAAYDTPRHLWHFSKKSIEKIFTPKGFKLEKIKPMIFDSFYVSLLSEKYKTGTHNYIKAFLVGLLSNIKAISTKEYSSHIYILKKLE